MLDPRLLPAGQLFVAAVVGTLLFSFAILAKWAIFTPLRHVPGPWYASWTDLWLKYHIMAGNRSQYIHSLHQAYGPFVRIGPTEVSVSDIPSFKTVYRVGSKFNKTAWYERLDEGHSGVFDMTDPKEHAARRRLFAQSFSNTSLLRFEPVIRKKVEIALSKIERDAKAGTADLLKWFTFMSTDVMGELSFGKSFDMLQQEEKIEYIRDLETALMINSMRAEFPRLMKLAKFLPVNSLRNVLKLNDRMEEYGMAAIRNHSEHVARSSDSTSNSLFSKFLDPTKNQELSLQQLSAESSNLIVAGSDTTAVSLTYLVWSVLRPQHRSIKEKLMAEIDSLPNNASLAEIGTLKYLKNVIDESLRLYGAAPGSLPRVTPAEGAEFGDHFLPPGTTVSVQAYTVHRDETIFQSPERFIPERWDTLTQDMKDAYFPFGAGSRACLGIHLAMHEMLLGAFLFFKTCPNLILARSTTDESMEFENYFLITPKAHRCEVTADQSL